MTQKSTDKSFAFLFKMSDVFEKFIEKMYKEIDLSSIGQYSKSFGKLHLKPDIHTDSKIIDIKYKSYDNSSLDRNDKYQMYVYGKNFAIKDTMIIYPKHINRQF
jgi:5-methylcytosine-specific restriction enzyme subunit McrC